MPCDNQKLRAEIAQRPTFSVPDSELLGENVENELTAIFEKEIAFNRVIEDMKQQMHSSKQFDYKKAFLEIDDWNYGFIDHKNLKSFLRKHGFVAKRKDLMAIIRRLDLDGDAKLGYEEFKLGLEPMEPYSKMAKRQKERERSGK
jgi:Ca2+-binding EF-hand superfamily protein